MRKNPLETSVLVTDAGRGSAVTIIRCLGRAGYKVIAADALPKSIGFKSRYVSDRLVYPSPESDPNKFIEFLLGTVASKKVDLIIPVTDLVIHPILSVRESFERITRIALPSNKLVTTVSNKSLIHQLARDLGVPVPETFVTNSAEEALRLAKKMTFPVVLKPQHSSSLTHCRKVESFAVTYANSMDELKRSMEEFHGKVEVLLQRYHKGAGFGVEFLMHEGEPIAAFAHKRLREIPITGGASAYRESVGLDDKLHSYALSLLRELGWTGLAMVEFKVNGDDAVLMEINGRIWGSLPLAVASGVNFPLLLTQLYLDGPEAAKSQFQPDYTIGLRSRDLQKDLMWIVSVLTQRRKYPFLEIPGRLAAFKAMAGYVNPKRKFDLFCLDDTRPAFAEIPRIARHFREKIRAT